MRALEIIATVLVAIAALPFVLLWLLAYIVIMIAGVIQQEWRRA